ncbi:Nuclear polyadenylated RNA-binding protein 4 [Lasiodiplodia hormozganensis]|uniref:Nuclear polyadenylated RNA-binding protein 4 n=2 Tax=Lasiodiplodia TaxID=66739 RepID=A0A5N5DTA5_9PEZI|nr:Rrm domain-containing protein [Lasiodiplodia theobromae]KAB2580621.1 Nuclear polyadenylated RNA-binding protein 4 [Lasiodiplodia theobromae]KAF4541419.1 Rrm domain-containing protein [Lasiodiplodia theobromae]KAK0661376.1 Nuclear polyadenylated RNA-binding protein 4 [Lasiodiplodia hormozganensis]
MADDDNFDIDIYGDDAPQDSFNNNSEVKAEAHEESLPDASQQADNAHPNGAMKQESRDNSVKQEDPSSANADERQQISSTGGSSHNQLQPPKQAPVQQGVKRKEGADDRVVDVNATTALLISDLHWWTNEDDIRGWANQSGCEDELVDVTFNEHKVNGKSKGQCFVEMASPQAATALKHTIESFGQGQQYAKKHSASYHAPHVNPYRTLPKDVPNRKDGNRNDNRSSSGSFGGGSGMNTSFNNSGGFRGGRGGFNNRGGMNNMGYNNRGGFNGPMGGGNMGPSGGFGGGPMGGFGGGPMGGMNNMGFNNFGRGGMMGGMRGGMANRGRGGMNGGMNANMMGGMGPMGGMAGMGMNPGMMGGMGGNMNMGMGGMQGGFGGGGAQPHFNPAFFGNQQSGGGGGGGDGNWNPHGAKRPRPE